MLANCCQICQSQAGIPHLVREMILGERREFLYWECSGCKCLSLADIPGNLEQYHAQSYSNRQTVPPGITGKIVNRLQLSPLARLFNKRVRADLDILRQIPLTKSMKLLEVGCGRGSLLRDLRQLGYDARGIDPFVPGDIEDEHGTCVTRIALEEQEGEFDAVLFFHSLGQLPIDTLPHTREHVKSDGWCVVRLPILGWAWRSYGTDWAHLDAPRNLFLHSQKSFRLLAEKSGFVIERVVFDSDEFQFWASESNQRRIPLNQMEAPTASQLARMRRLARDLNRQEQGDTARFYLRPA